MHTLDETSCAKGKPLRSLWTADEARMVKHILNNLTVKQWNLPSTEVERDLSGDWTIWIPEGGGGSGASEYRSYFKVIDASTTNVCKIGVTDGGWLNPNRNPIICGTVKVNKFVVDVPTYLSDSILVAGFFYVWLVSWISESDGAGSTIVAGDKTRPTETAISAPDVISYRSQLLGRVYVELVEGKARIMGITQDYLRGGEAVELLWGICGDDVEVDL